MVIGYIINYQKSSKSVISQKNLQCSSCGENLLGNDPNYCSNCGHMNSHSVGSNLEK